MRKTLVMGAALAALMATPASARDTMEQGAPLACSGYQFLLSTLLQDIDAEKSAERLERAQRWFAFHLQETGMDEDMAFQQVERVVLAMENLRTGTAAEQAQFEELGSQCITYEYDYDEDLRLAKVRRDLAQ